MGRVGICFFFFSFFYHWSSAVQLFCSPVWFSPSFFCLGFIDLLQSVGLQFLSNLENIHGYFSKYFFCTPTASQNPIMCLLFHRSLVHSFQSFFSLFFIFYLFLFPCLQVHQSFPLQSESLINTVQCILHFRYYNFLSLEVVEFFNLFFLHYVPVFLQLLEQVKYIYFMSVHSLICVIFVFVSRDWYFF